MRVLVSPSLMCADICRLEDEVRRLEALGVDMLHFDIMDAHFVPNMPLGLGVLEALRPRTSLPFDVHLMVDRNDWFIEEVARLGAQQIAIHAESAVHLDRSLTLIRSCGARAGVALNPATPPDRIAYVLERVDFVLLMAVNPGFAGQDAVPSSLRKIADSRALLDTGGTRVPLAVDGNVGFRNIPDIVAMGADLLVAGTSSLFHKDGSLEENMTKIREGVRLGLDRRAAKGDRPGGSRVAKEMR